MLQLTYLAGQVLANAPMALVTAAGLVLLALRGQARRGLALAGCAVLFGATVATVAWWAVFPELIAGDWMGYELIGSVGNGVGVLLGLLHAVGVGLLLAAFLLRSTGQNETSQAFGPPAATEP